MEQLSNIVFDNNTFYAGWIRPDNNVSKTDILKTKDLLLYSTCIDMIVSDVATEEKLATFRVSALLVKANDKNKLQNLMLKSNFTNTYRLSIDFFRPETDVYSLCGRNTSANRQEARKFLLAGLSAANYTNSIENARRDTLYSFSNHIVATVFDPSVKAQENVPLVNTWLTHLLG